MSGTGEHNLERIQSIKNKKDMALVAMGTVMQSTKGKIVMLQVLDRFFF